MVTKKFASTTLIVLFLSSAFIGILYNSIHPSNVTYTQSVYRIRFRSNSELTSYISGGSGTLENPYVINNVKFGVCSFSNLNNILFTNCYFESSSVFLNCLNIQIDTSKLYECVIYTSINISMTESSLTYQLRTYGVSNLTIANNTFTLYDIASTPMVEPYCVLINDFDNRYQSENMTFISNTIYGYFHGIIAQNLKYSNITSNHITTTSYGIELLNSENCSIFYNKLMTIQRLTSEYRRIAIYNAINLKMYNEYDLTTNVGNYYGDFAKYHQTDPDISGIVYKNEYVCANPYSSDLYVDPYPLISYNLLLPTQLYVNELGNITYFYRDSRSYNLIWYPSTELTYGRTNYNITRNNTVLYEHNNIRFYSNTPIILNVNNLPIGSYNYTITLSNGYTTTQSSSIVSVVPLSEYNDDPVIVAPSNLQYFYGDIGLHQLTYLIIDENYLSDFATYSLSIYEGGIYQNITQTDFWLPNENINIDVDTFNLPAGYYSFEMNITDGFTSSIVTTYVLIAPSDANYPPVFVKTPTQLSITSNDINNYKFEWVIYDPNSDLSSHDEFYQIYYIYNNTVPVLYLNQTYEWNSLETITLNLTSSLFDFRDYIGTFEIYINATKYPYEENMVSSPSTYLHITHPISNTLPILNEETIYSNITIYDSEIDDTRILNWNIIDITTSNPSYQIFYELDTDIWVNWYGKLEELYGSGTYNPNEKVLWNGRDVTFDVKYFVETLFDPIEYDTPISFRLIFFDGFIENGLILNEFSIIYKHNTPIIPIIVPEYTNSSIKELIKFDTDDSQLKFRFIDDSVGPYDFNIDWNDDNALIVDKIPHYFIYRNGTLVQRNYFYSLVNIIYNIPFLDINFAYNYSIEVHDGLGDIYRDYVIVRNLRNYAPVIYNVLSNNEYIAYDDDVFSINVCQINDTTTKTRTYKIYENGEEIANTYIWENNGNIYLNVDNKPKGVYNYEFVFTDGAGYVSTLSFQLEIRSSKPYGDYDPFTTFKWIYLVIIIIGLAIAIGLIVIVSKRNNRVIENYVQTNKQLWDNELNT